MRISGALLLLTLAGCAADVPGGDVVVRDSAGITLVENPAPDTTRIFARLVEPPALSIGTVEGAPEQILHDVAGAVRLSDGRIVIANGGTELRFYDTGGGHLRTVGRSGRGPGEFTRLSALLLAAGDTLLAYDSGNQRLTVLTPQGELVREHRLETGGERSLYVSGRFSDGTLLALTGITSYDRREYGDGVMRPPQRALRFAADLSSADTLVEYPGIEMHFQPRRWGPLTAGRRTHVLAHDTLLYLGAQEHGWEVGVFGLDGIERRRIRLDAPATPSAPLVRRVLDSARVALPPDQAADVERRYAETPIPEVLPPHGPLLADGEGNLWVSDYAWFSLQPRRWTVFDPEGRLRGLVEMPREEPRLLQVGTEHALALDRDELGVERVVVYRLER